MPSNRKPRHLASGVSAELVGLTTAQLDVTSTVPVADIMATPVPLVASLKTVTRWGTGFMRQSGNDLVSLASPQSFGHLAGSGCVGWIDPVERVTVEFVSNGNVGTGEDEGRDRLESVLDVGLSAV